MIDISNSPENIAEEHGKVALFLNAYCKLHKNTPEKYKEEAKKIFGIEDLDISKYLTDEGFVHPYVISGRGYFWEPVFETEENGIITVRMQGYVDYMRTIKSDVYEYKFADKGDYLEFVSSEIVSEGEFPIGGISG